MKRTLHPPAADVKQKIYKISNKSTSPTTNSQGKLVGWAQKTPASGDAGASKTMAQRRTEHYAETIEAVKSRLAGYGAGVKIVALAGLRCRRNVAQNQALF
jgi:hypothetical protein